MRHLNKRVLAIFFGAIALLTTIDYFVYSTEIEVGLGDIGGFILNNTILVGLILIAYLLMKYIQSRRNTPKE